MTSTIHHVARRSRGPAAAVAGLLLAGLLAACGGADDEPGAGTDPTETASDESADAEPDDPASEETEEGSDDTEPSADSEPTEPGTVLEADEPAIVSLPYGSRGRGLYAIDLVSVERRPASDIPADLPVTSPSDLYFVTQDWTMLDVGTGSVNGMNLLQHTSVSIGDDFQITSVPFADFDDCRVAQFIAEDGDAGKTRESCTAYLVPKGESIEQVWYFEFKSEFDFSTGGSAVRWRVQDVEG